MVQAKAKITFRMCVHDSLEYGSDDEHVVSRVFFILEIKDKRYGGLYVDIKHAAGSELESEQLEVGKPVGYEGPFNDKAFQDAVKKYYRNLVISKCSGTTRKHDNTYTLDISVVMELE
jgi:hypothetical protein